MLRYWKVKPAWAGQAAFIVAGGPSVTSADLDLVRGRRTIVINSSYEALPEADVLFFADLRWWKLHRERVEAGFKGKVVTTSVHSQGPKLVRLMRKDPDQKNGGFAEKPYQVCCSRTSLTASINLAVHLGSRDLVLLGADLKDGPDGRTSHHEPHPWKRKPNTWDVKLKQLALMRPTLDKLGVRVFNASPDSAMTWWRRGRLEEWLDGEAEEGVGRDGGPAADAAGGAAQDQR